MRVRGGFGKDPLHNTLRQLARALILFLHDRYPLSDLDIFSVTAVLVFISHDHVLPMQAQLFLADRATEQSWP